MKVKFLKLKNWLLVTLMGAMGLSSCHCHKGLVEPKTEPETTPDVRDRGEMRLMYGVPTMNYMIRGQVKSPDGKPLKDIRVNMLERGMEVSGTELQGDAEAVSSWLENTAVKTDKKGRFEIKNSGIPQERVRLIVRDVDGKENGEYKDRVVEMDVTPADVDKTDAAGWNQGTFDKDVEIELETR